MAGGAVFLSPMDWISDVISRLPTPLSFPNLTISNDAEQLWLTEKAKEDQKLTGKPTVAIETNTEAWWAQQEAAEMAKVAGKSVVDVVTDSEALWTAQLAAEKAKSAQLIQPVVVPPGTVTSPSPVPVTVPGQPIAKVIFGNEVYWHTEYARFQGEQQARFDAESLKPFPNYTKIEPAPSPTVYPNGSLPAQDPFTRSVRPTT